MLNTRTTSFSNIFLPGDSPMRGIKTSLVNNKNAVVSIRKNVVSSCSTRSEDNSSQSVLTESDSGFASSTEESVFRKKNKNRRSPGSSIIGEIFARASSNSVISGDYQLRMVKELRIEAGSVGYGYDKLFSDGLNEHLREVSVEDPYVFTESQICNFVVFCEVLVSRAPNLKRIVLRTKSLKPDHRNFPFTELEQSLLARRIHLEIQRSNTIHDREIRFDNGWTYRIGRGLDYFQKQQGNTLGLSNYNFRRCLETSVCITKEPH